MRRAKTRLVAVEDGLTPIADALRDKGYAVMPFDKADLDRVDAVVVSGQDDNVMGIPDIRTKAPVINAEGLTADEVAREVEERLGPLDI